MVGSRADDWAMPEPTMPPPIPELAPRPPEAARTEADPGNARRAGVAWAVIVTLLSLLVVINQFSSVFARRFAPPVAAAAKEAGKIEPPEAGDPLVPIARLAVKLRHSSNPEVGRMVASSFVPPEGDSDDLLVDRFRYAIVTAEVRGAEEGRKQIEGIERSLAERGKGMPALSRHVGWVRLILDRRGDELSSESRDELASDHGYFGDLALSLEADDASPSRARLIGGGDLLLGFFGVVGVGGAVVGVASLVCFVVALVRIAGGRVRWRFVPPAPGGSVYLETFAALLVGFLVFKFAMGLAGMLLEKRADPGTLLTVTLGAQWLLVPCAFWAVFRGVGWARFRRQSGFNAGEGLVREVGAGVFAYLASLPVFLMAAVVTAGLVWVRQAVQKSLGVEPTKPGNPIQDLLVHATNVQLVVLFVLATCWAPLVEELVFRGSVYRHLRSRMGMAGSAVVSAILFGLMHGYEWMLLLPVMTLGFNFAVVREWRSSLAASMVMHFLHNAGTLALAIVFMKLVGS